MMSRHRMFAAMAVATMAVATTPDAMAGSRDWRQVYEEGLFGGAYAAGESIGTAAVNGQGGYDGGAPTGYGGGRGPADRPCFVRRPVFDQNGTRIGYRGTQLC